MIIFNNIEKAGKISDDELIKLLEARDDTALRIIESKYGSKCYSVALGILGNESDAEECINDMLLKIWKSIPPNKPDSLLAYAVAITKNSSIDRYKTQRRKMRIPPEKQEPLESAENIGVLDVDPSDKEAVAALITGFLRKYDKDRRNLFIARFYYGFSESELSRKTGINPKTISSSLSRMKKDLEKYLISEGVEL